MTDLLFEQEIYKLSLRHLEAPKCKDNVKKIITTTANIFPIIGIYQRAQNSAEKDCNFNKKANETLLDYSSNRK